MRRKGVKLVRMRSFLKVSQHYWGHEVYSEQTIMDGRLPAPCFSSSAAELVTDCEVVSTTSSRGSVSNKRSKTREGGYFGRANNSYTDGWSYWSSAGRLVGAAGRRNLNNDIAYSDHNLPLGHRLMTLCPSFTSVGYDELAGQGQGGDWVLANQCS